MDSALGCTRPMSKKCENFLTFTEAKSIVQVENNDEIESVGHGTVYPSQFVKVDKCFMYYYEMFCVHRT